MAEDDGAHNDPRKLLEETRAELERYKSHFGTLPPSVSNAVSTSGLNSFAKALPILAAYLDCQSLLTFRLFSKDWRRTVDHFLETEQLQRAYLQVYEKLSQKSRKSVVLDLEKRYTFTTPEIMNQFMNVTNGAEENPVLGKAIVFQLAAEPLGLLPQSIAVTKYYAQKTDLEAANENLCSGLDKLCDFYRDRVELLLFSYGKHLTCLTFYQYELGLTPKTLYKNLVVMLSENRVPNLKRLIIDGQLQPVLTGAFEAEAASMKEMQRREDELEVYLIENEFPRLEHLDKLEFWFDDKSTLPVFNKVLASCPALTTIHCNGLPELSGKLLREKEIKTVVIKYLGTSGEGISNRWSGLKYVNPTLETLSLDSNFGIIGLSEIEEVAQRLTQLTSLGLRGNIQFPGNAKCRQDLQCLFVQNLTVFHTGQENHPEFYTKLISYFPNLQNLEITEQCEVKWNGGVDVCLGYPICNDSCNENVYRSGLWDELKNLKLVTFKGISGRYSGHSKTYTRKGQLKFLSVTNKFWNQYTCCS